MNDNYRPIKSMKEILGEIRKILELASEPGVSKKNEKEYVNNDDETSRTHSPTGLFI